MAIGNEDVAALERAVVVGSGGEELGVVHGVYYDNRTDRPVWVAVGGGTAGPGVSLVPLTTASLRGDALHVPYDREQLGRAPHHDADRELSPQDEIDLYRYYGVDYDTGADADVDADAMTRSEEQLRVHTASQPVERVRLRKHVVTEYRQITVPVRREEIRVERVPVGEADVDASDVEYAGSVGDPGAGSPVDDEQEVVLYAERPVVTTETVAVERIRLGKHTVTGQETVGGEVRREVVEFDDATDPEVRGTPPDDVRRG